MKIHSKKGKMSDKQWQDAYIQFDSCPKVTLSTSEIQEIVQRIIERCQRFDSKPVEIAFGDLHSNVRVLFDVIFPYLSEHYHCFMKTRELRTTPDSLIVYRRVISCL